MRALSYHGPGRAAWETAADPEITHDLDAVIRVGTVTISSPSAGRTCTFSRATCTNVGVHGKLATLHLEDQWARDITITTGLVARTARPPCSACWPAARSGWAGS